VVPAEDVVTIEAPVPVSGRLAKLLRQERIAYDVVVHDETHTAQHAAAAAHVAGRYLAKVVVVKGTTGEPFLLVLPAPHRLDPGAVERAVGCRELRLLDDEEIGRLFPDCGKGEIPPFGGLYGLPTYVDACLARRPWIYFSSGSHRQTFGMRWEDYQRIARPVVGGFCFHDSGE
jgi:Ala-tRNA(Pro) deacylase